MQFPLWPSSSSTANTLFLLGLLVFLGGLVHILLPPPVDRILEVPAQALFATGEYLYREIRFDRSSLLVSLGGLTAMVVGYVVHLYLGARPVTYSRSRYSS